MGTVESIGDAEESGQFAYHAAERFRQVAVYFMAGLRVRFPVVPGKACNYAQFNGSKAFEARHENRITGSLVMSGGAFRVSNIV